ncbi:MAG TPA: class I SAM-dependent methyltransferase [Campylobacterales bacterium]|nr:class I SAM-dependent methyltransferase [Campylobacterales bacterium]
MKQGDFTNLAKHYINRPAYSELLLEKLLKTMDLKPDITTKVADIGAGTGKFTKMLSELGLAVTAVEPNDAMREEGKIYTDGQDISWVSGSGENTTLSEGYFDWACMASSFHWTDPDKSLPEFARILKSGGHFTAIWNPRNIKISPFHMNIEEQIRSIVPELNRVSSGAQNAKEWEYVLTSTGDFCDCVFMECDHTEVMTKERYMGAWHSVNDIQAQAGADRWAKIIDMIENEIKDMQFIEVPYKIRAWTVKKA